MTVNHPVPGSSPGGGVVDVAELVYALGLGSSEATHEGSSPFIDTKYKKLGKPPMQIVEPYSTILVLNSSYEPLHFTNWKRAIILLFKDKAKLISKRVIRLVNYVRLPFIRLGETFPSRNLIYKRDNYQCQYCGSKQNLTIDHVKPKSKGGNDTWTNLVTACSSCNVKKGSKTLKESGLVLRSSPRAPISIIMLDLEKTTISEWKEYVWG